MQRNRDELTQMNQAELVERVLEMQDIMRESLRVRSAMQQLLNRLLKLKADEVGHFAALDISSMDVTDDQKALKAAWGEARLALANPSMLMKKP